MGGLSNLQGAMPMLAKLGPTHSGSAAALTRAAKPTFCGALKSPPPLSSPSLIFYAYQVGKLVGGLSNLQGAMPMLAKLGLSHSGRFITSADFDTLREALLETLAERLGPIRWTREVRPPSLPPPPPYSLLCWASPARGAVHRPRRRRHGSLR